MRMLERGWLDRGWGINRVDALDGGFFGSQCLAQSSFIRDSIS